MKRVRILLLTVAVFMGAAAAGQNCNQLGQNPSAAFPVCGTVVFTQSSVPICGNRVVPGPCPGIDLTDKNPYWYRFTCYAPGSLGFQITPNNLQDDYDWQLFDITNESPNAVYSKKSLFVACNWSGEPGITGARLNGQSLVVCEGKGKALFSAMPDLIAGHEYLLLVSHFTDSQSGYTLEFGGGSADIIDPKIPEMVATTAVCTGNELRVKLSKEMKCSSVAADGSDFSLSSNLANITSANSPMCSASFSTDSIVILLDRPLPPGDYTLNVKSGSDGNSMLDNCDNNMPDGSTTFTVHENVSAAFSYTLKEGCIQDTIEFSHDGANHTRVWNWTSPGGNLNSASGSIISTTTGPFELSLTIANDFCSASQTETISIPPKVNAAFLSPEISCAKDLVTLSDNSVGAIATWNWDFGDGNSSTEQNPQPFKYQLPTGERNYKVRLQVATATGCTDSVSANILVVGSCNIMVPTGFTPNNDGINDYLFPTNGFAADNMVFRVFNRFGRVVFESYKYQQKWDGNVNGQPQSSGTYAWTLSYTLKSTGRQYFFKGTTVLLR